MIFEVELRPTRVVLIADRINDPQHRDPNPQWLIDQVEIKDEEGEKWRAMDKGDPLYGLLCDLIIEQQSEAIEQAWGAFLAAEANEEREYEPEVA